MFSSLLCISHLLSVYSFIIHWFNFDRLNPCHHVLIQKIAQLLKFALQFLNLLAIRSYQSINISSHRQL
ncbi:hypothetical protein L596_022274 [Steinernema carpocapsae]|uniref:Uncharacterized protein n=1 Tax=Steinernema carpocapsae TaxID=34508 RepID=A0A4U5MM34_STECR|nr:hypothetical protein L596_022274 [Steinernema carpocapsae]